MSQFSSAFSTYFACAKCSARSLPRVSTRSRPGRVANVAGVKRTRRRRSTASPSLVLDWKDTTVFRRTKRPQHRRNFRLGGSVDVWDKMADCGKNNAKTDVYLSYLMFLFANFAKWKFNTINSFGKIWTRIFSMGWKTDVEVEVFVVVLMFKK